MPVRIWPVRGALWLVACFIAIWQLGCAGHEARVKAALDALDRGQPKLATAELNAEMEVESNQQLPDELQGSDNALLLLDRATILQSMDDFELSARDFGAADKAIDLLDISRDTADEVGRYLFSDDTGPYRAPPFEKLMVNTFNLMNYLSMRDLEGARVEARRLEVMQRYLADKQETTSLNGIGSYLAGFTYEKSGKRDPALNHYEDALAYGEYASLREPLRVLTQGKPRSKRIDTLVGDLGPHPSVAETGESELLVVVGYGRVPPKVPTRIPIGVALSLVAHHLSPRDRATANELVAKGLVTWVNFPRLGKSRGKHAVPRLWVDGEQRTLEHAIDVEAEVRKEWKEREPTVILSAITRMITRAVAGEILHRSAATQGKNAGLAGLVAGLATTATLAILDTPDTRSWVTLPSNVAIARLRVKPGKHRIQIRARGWEKGYSIQTAPGNWGFVAMTSLR
jgi:tetratricopeptide (TPR) repeat protein